MSTTETTFSQFQQQNQFILTNKTTTNFQENSSVPLVELSFSKKMSSTKKQQSMFTFLSTQNSNKFTDFNNNNNFCPDYLTNQNQDEDNYHNDLNDFEDNNLDQLFEQQQFQEDNIYKPSFNFDDTYKQGNTTQINHQQTHHFESDELIQESPIEEKQEQENQEQKQILSSSEDDEILDEDCLNPIDEEDLQDANKAFMEFPAFDSEDNNNTQLQNENLQEEDQQQIKQEDKFLALQNNKPQIWKVTQSIQKKKKQRDYDKNICRYIARCVIRCCADKTYESKVTEFCSQFSQNNNGKQLYTSTVNFLLSKIEFITGHRAFRDLLCFEEDDQFLNEKQVFRKFTYWFLKERAFRYIMTGAMTDKKSYLKFKNSIMLLYVKKPENWTSNAKIPSKRR